MKLICLKVKKITKDTVQLCGFKQINICVDNYWEFSNYYADGNN